MSSKYSVFSCGDDVCIEIATDNDATCDEWCYQGTFDFFSNAKKYAAQIMTTKVVNFKCDYEIARMNKNKLSRLKKTDIV